MARKPAGRREKADDTTAERLLRLTSELYPFHGPDGTPYVTVRVNGHSETLAVRGPDFPRLLRTWYFDDCKSTPGMTALREAVDHVDALACMRGDEHDVFLRAGEQGGALFLDLGDPTWRCVEVTAQGHIVVPVPLVRFRRSQTMRPLPEPSRPDEADLSLLRRYLRLSDEDAVLLFAFLVQALRSQGPYPALVFVGEQGAGKTVATEMVKAMVDPSSIPTRAVPRDVRDLLIAAENTHLLAFNNLSGLQGWLSDALCTLLFGGGFATRRLHSNRDEEAFHLARPVVLNGIEDLTARPDFADRAIVLRLQPIPETERQTEADLWAGFERDLPRILSGLLVAVSTGLRRLPGLRPHHLPRMADFARWALAAEPAFGLPHVSFLDAYRANRAQTFEEALDLDPVAEAVMSLVTEEGEWEGTTSDLRTRLRACFPDGPPSDYPATAQRMAGRLRRIAPVLRAEKIEIDRNRTGRARTVRIRRLEDPS